MRAIRCSGRLREGYVPGGCLPEGVSAWEGGVYTPRPRGRHPPPPVDRILDTRLWKHNLSSTIVHSHD